QVLVFVGVMLMSGCASSSARVTTQRAPVVVAVPLPRCIKSEPRAVEGGFPRCACAPEDQTVCSGRDCSCVNPEPLAVRAGWRHGDDGGCEPAVAAAGAKWIWHVRPNRP